ncbi:MAG: STAS domain-containing protein [Desulfobacterales bacterium]|nr:STAS domain-containing protein [Desulfobacterales bacterium]
MDLITEKIGDITVAAIQVKVLDASNTKEFKLAVAPIFEGTQKVILDLSNVTFIDSTGCGALIFCLKQLNATGGGLKIFGVQNPVRNLFERIRIHRTIDILNTKEEAVEAF